MNKNSANKDQNKFYNSQADIPSSKKSFQSESVSELYSSKFNEESVHDVATEDINVKGDSLSTLKVQLHKKLGELENATKKLCNTTEYESFLQRENIKELLKNTYIKRKEAERQRAAGEVEELKSQSRNEPNANFLTYKASNAIDFKKIIHSLKKNDAINDTIRKVHITRIPPVKQNMILKSPAIFAISPEDQVKITNAKQSSRFKSTAPQRQRPQSSMGNVPNQIIAGNSLAKETELYKTYNQDILQKLSTGRRIVASNKRYSSAKKDNGRPCYMNDTDNSILRMSMSRLNNIISRNDMHATHTSFSSASKPKILNTSVRTSQKLNFAIMQTSGNNTGIFSAENYKPVIKRERKNNSIDITQLINGNISRNMTSHNPSYNNTARNAVKINKDLSGVMLL